MLLLLVQREATDLYSTLLTSETSRNILRFYRPKKLDYGVSITCVSLGSLLSLTSELRWYLRRYVQEAIVEIAPGECYTLSLAEEIYLRLEAHEEARDYKKRLYIREGSVAAVAWPECDEDADGSEGADTVLDVWCSESEFNQD
ncbi:MAG: DUF5804 family protein [Methanomicrobiaceae archaeon]|nr:DUF5804 family protein [Methanomicrobiaceae archaeon]